MELLYWFILIFGGFFLGSIMFCQIIPMKVCRIDVSKVSPDHNPGAFNVFKICGAKVGIPCVTLDILKGLIPVLLSSLLMNTNSPLYILSVIAPALGCAIGVFNSLRGGKCIAVSFGILAGMIPVTWIPFVTLAGLYLFFSLVIRINPGSRRSVVVYSLLAVISLVVLPILGLYIAAPACVLLALIPILRFTVWKPNEDGGKVLI